MFHRKLQLTGYIRTGDSDLSADAQKLEIEKYCADHDFRLIGFAETDKDIPCHGFIESLLSLKQCDGIITFDLNRLVHNSTDRLREVRCIVDRLMHEHRVLISISEGIETCSATGQAVLFDMLSNWSERGNLGLPNATDFESVNAGHSRFPGDGY